MACSKHNKYNSHSCFVDRAARHQSVGHVLVFRGITYLSETLFPGVFQQVTEAFSRKHAKISTHVHNNSNFLENGSFNWKKRSGLRVTNSERGNSANFPVNNFHVDAYTMLLEL